MTARRNTRHLVERSTQGDERAKESLLAEHFPRLLAFVRLHAGEVVRAHESCADVVQSVFREVLDGEFGDFEYRGEAQLRSWLCKHALHKIRNRQRFYLAARRDARRNLPTPQPDLCSGVAALYASLTTPSQDAIAAETVARFEAAFDQLSEKDQQIYSLAKIHGMSHAEIADELGIVESSVRARLHRALARLGTLMHVAEHGSD